MDGEPKEEDKNQVVDASGSDSEEEEEEISKDELNEGLLTACRENDMENVLFYLGKRDTNPLFEKDGWTPLLWAACNGNEEIVKELMKKGVHEPYEHGKTDDMGDQKADEETQDPFVKPKDARKVGRYTPLHWASYKGHYKIVCKFLKGKLSPLDIDMYGNTAVHQAAAAGEIKVLECFLMRGVDVDVKNARLHTPLDLATEPKTKELINKASKTTHCANKTCSSRFDFKNIRYFCNASAKFYCKKCSMIDWAFEDWTSEEQERPICRSHAVDKQVKAHEKELAAAMDKQEYEELDKALGKCTGIDIDVKLLHNAGEMHKRLKQELKMKTFLAAKDHHDNYKDIKKDVERINNMVQEAEEQEIKLDSNLVAQVNAFTSRLISERNLRKQRDLFIEGISSCDQSKVDKLQGLIDDASKNAVETEYIQHASKLTG